MDQELIAYLDERFQRIDSRFEQIDSRFQRIDSRFEQIDSRFEQVHDEIRHTRIEVEGLRGEVRLLAEGQMSTEEKLERFRSEVAREFEETRGSIKVPYMDLGGRIRSLEDWRERRDQTDPMDLIRERYGKRP